MVIGEFLDTWPKAVFIVAHLLMLCVGIWAAMTAKRNGVPYANAFWLYVVVHLGFLAYLFDVFALRLSVLLEQMLILVMVLWIVMKGKSGQMPPTNPK